MAGGGGRSSKMLTGRGRQRGAGGGGRSSKMLTGRGRQRCHHWKHHHRSAVGGALSWNHCRWRAVATVWWVLASLYNYTESC